MSTLRPDTCSLLVIDFQTRLMPAIDAGEIAVRNTGRLLDAARLLDVPILATEQNPKGLGETVPGLREKLSPEAILTKMSFDACRTPGFVSQLSSPPRIVVTGCEAHVCVLQTVLGLLQLGRRVYVVRDAIGSRAPENKDTAIRRMERHGAEIVTTEMVIFEWLGTATHPRFREAVALIK
jgi:nicotinamidase-related amidase